MAWTRRTRIDSHVEGRPLIVVMPDGERGFYADSRSNPRAAFETYLVRDVIGFVDTAFPTIPERSGCVVGGPSMGGYGALRLALRHPDLSRAAVSHAGAVEFASHSWVGEERRHWAVEYAPVFGEAPRGGPDDLVALAERVDRVTLPALRIDRGVEAELIAPNRRFHRYREAPGIPHEYGEVAGGHDWD